MTLVDLTVITLGINTEYLSVKQRKAELLTPVRAAHSTGSQLYPGSLLIREKRKGLKALLPK